MQEIAHVTAFSSCSQRSAALAIIRKEIAATEAALHAWKCRHNELSLTFRLPPELLSRIFLHHRDAEKHTLAWTRISHICSRWRQIALECPSLWTDIPLRNEKWAEEMLKRSKVAPLTISARPGVSKCVYWTGRKLEVLRTVLTQLPRAWEFHIVERYYSQAGHFSPPLAQIARYLEIHKVTAPFLEVFDLEFFFALDTNRLPDTILKDSRCLRRLRLVNGGLDWSSLASNSLTSLHIVNVPRGIRPQLSQITTCLARQPRLENLSLCFDFISNSTNEATPPTTPITLLHLQSLILQDCSLSNCILLLERIFYPPSTNVCLTPIVESWRSTNNTSLMQEMFRCLEKRLPGPINTLSVGDHYVSIGALPVTIPEDTEDTGHHGPQVEVNLPFYNRQMLVAILSCLSLDDLEVLGTDELHLEADDWVAHFGELDNLYSIKVGKTLGFPDALISGIPSPCASYLGITLKFSALSHLTITNWPWDFDVSRLGRTWAEHLTACLSIRKEVGDELPMLNVESWSQIKGLDDLRGVVQRLFYGVGDQHKEPKGKKSMRGKTYCPVEE